MAHYAYINKQNIVIDVIVGKDENETIDGLHPEDYYALGTNLLVKRTSYNARIRKNYAGIGYTYDAKLDAFIPPKPNNAIGFDEETCQWIVPKEESNGETL